MVVKHGGRAPGEGGIVGVGPGPVAWRVVAVAETALHLQLLPALRRRLLIRSVLGKER